MEELREGWRSQDFSLVMSPEAMLNISKCILEGEGMEIKYIMGTMIESRTM